MNKEELIGKLQMVYVGERNALNELIGYYNGLKQGIEELQKENKELKEDISFCLHSIKQEMKMSTDSRTRNEMTSCYDILKRWNTE